MLTRVYHSPQLSLSLSLCSTVCVVFTFYFETHFWWSCRCYFFRMEKKRERDKKEGIFEIAIHDTTAHTIECQTLTLWFLSVASACCRIIYIGCQYVLSPSQHAYDLLIVWTCLFLYSLHLICFRSKIRNDNILQLLFFLHAKNVLFLYHLTLSLLLFHSF